ncbi:DNA-binding protein [Streptomyces sp. HNM0575]|uniref:helicase-associated domain-containing protein n=1 Tax=Streptomyces sp. HNM0575 TaxID=2716338 RepID=UPI00145F5F46|nr:helicase-associated domain-containing protein [Streptomyces sp. HNM0575]NLU74207.1 DNA-binding protein [Streptomyces sp. HNM0575]
MSTEHSGGSGAAPRTLADDLRARDDAALAELLRTRPDLLSPVPNDLTQLATRAGTRASVVRAVERLDRFALQTAEAIAVAPDPCPYGTLEALLAGDPEADTGGPDTDYADPAGAATREAVAAELSRALRTLREQALLWGDDDRLHLVRTARELLTPSPSAPSPTGLGPTLAEATAGMSPGRLQDILAHAGLPGTHDPVSALAALSALFADRERTDALLEGAPVESLAMLDRLRWGPPYGSVQSDMPSAPVTWLLDRGLLVRTAPRTVVLPREVALHLRGGRAHRDVEPLAPPPAVRREYPPEAVDETAAGQALAALGTLEDLLSDWESDPPSVLRAGGLGVRDLKRSAAALDLPEPTAAFWVELAYTAGLSASDSEPDEGYAPTPAYDEWLARPAHERWSRIVLRWLHGTRVPGLVGTRDAKGRGLAALGQGLDRGLAADVRRRTLELLAALEPGSAPTRHSVLERLRWERPLRGTGGAAGAASGDLRTQLAEWALHEAELLGLTGRGALASYARELVAPDGGSRTAAELEAAAARAAGRLAPLLPEPLDHILLQADLTAVAPGPLQRPLAAMLDVLADVESKGGATVYRFTPGSVRRALDAGRTASDIHAFLAAHSRTPVPQPLSYLVDDVARRHGRLRVGAASSYVRCDDDALLTEITADRRSAPMRLRLLAPTVLASPLPPDQLLAKLREMGYAPAAESAEGDVLIARADAHRTPPRTPPEPVPDGPPVPDAALLTAAVRAIRAGDHAANAETRAARPPGRGPKTQDASGGPLPRTTSADTIATMRSAAVSGEALWIGYVNADGAASRRVIAPVKVEGGLVTAYDHTADEVRTYPLHRITGVAELA